MGQTPYRLLKQLGAGAGMVFEDDDARHHRTVAGGFLPDDIARGPQTLMLTRRCFLCSSLAASACLGLGGDICATAKPDPNRETGW
jgi:hypothetical protein